MDNGQVLHVRAVQDLADQTRRRRADAREQVNSLEILPD